MSDTFFTQHMQRMASAMDAQTDLARGGSTHAGIIGASIEMICRKVLRQYLPAAFTIGTGQFANASRVLGPQMDILLYDGTVFPHLAVNEDDSVVICCESLIAGIECKTSWRGSGLEAHFKRFCEVDRGRKGWWANQGDLNAAYFVFLIDASSSRGLKVLQDPTRRVGVYSLKSNRCWQSPFGEDAFVSEKGDALELFVSHVLQETMRRGPAEIGSYERAYDAVRRYFGWPRLKGGEDYPD